MTPTTCSPLTIRRVEFPVDDVTPAVAALREVSYKEGLEALLKSPPPLWDESPETDVAEPFRAVESCSRYHGKLVAGIDYHPVVAAIHLAFSDHRPLVLSPDMIWLLVAQGLANHVNAHSEELRSLLVPHAGQLALQVRRDDFIKGSPENPWAEVFAAFSGQIREHLGAETHELIQPRFSTTGHAERAAAEVILLESMQSYFTCTMRTMCGIPRVILEGTFEDWVVLKDRTQGLARFQLGWWTEALAPILHEFVAASQGQANAPFWQSIYKLDGGSGGPYISGWINAFFPYLKDWQTGRASRRNDRLTAGRKALEQLLYPTTATDPDPYFYGVTTEALPGGLSKAPFRWEYLERNIDMEFLGGFVGVQQDEETLSLRPEIGWAVREAVVA